MAKRQLLVHAAALLGLCVFALPSCFTTTLWLEPSARTEPIALAATRTCVTTDAGGTVTGFAVRLGADPGPFGAAAANGWLLLDHLGDQPAVAAFVDGVRRGAVREARLAVLLDATGKSATTPDHAMLMLRGLRPDGDHSRVDCGSSLRIAAAVEPEPAPWPGEPADFGRQVIDMTAAATAGRVVLTPFAVTADVVTLPVQLLIYALIRL
jgi:hypothetical protein